MLSPYFFQSSATNHLICEPASSELLISVIGNREFRITELFYYSNDSFQGELQKVRALPDDSPYTDRQSHPSGDLFDYLQQISHQTKKVKIEFKEGGYIVLTKSVMEITLTESEDIKDIALLILEISGYTSAEDIWKLIQHPTGIQISIGTYFFMASPEKTKEIVIDSIKNNKILKDMEGRSKEIAAKKGNALPF
jgi:hypothetical protein